MALWPFRRKSGRKRPRSGAALSDAERAPPSPSHQGGPTAHHEGRQSPGTGRAASLKKQRTDQPPPSSSSQPNNNSSTDVNSKKLQRRARTYSFSPGRNDSIRVAGKGASGPQGPGRRARLPPGEQIEKEKIDEETAWERIPTLYNTRNGEKMKRKKSSKRRRDDHDREAEIKAMSSFVPVRPATDSGLAGRPMKKDSKRVKTGPGRHSNPASDVSLPLPESIHSTMSSESDHAAYKISALDSLAPRPTLRYASHPRYGPPSSTEPARTPSQKKRLTEPMPEATIRAHKRIDSLADDLDASDLRELMDRDKRRRERKAQKEQERMQRRLTRRAEQQREAEAEARKNGTPPPQNLERGVMGRESVGLGIDTTSAVVTSSRRRPSDASRHASARSSKKSAEQSRRPSADAMDVEAHPPAQAQAQAQPQEEATAHFHRVHSIPQEPAASSVPDLTAAPATGSSRETKAPVTPPPDDGKTLKGMGSFLRYKKSRSKTSLASDEKHTASTLPPTSDISESSRRDSTTSAGRGKRTFSSLFRWGTLRRNSRSSGPPPSFSNTSREEMQATAAQAQAAHAQALARLQSQSSDQVSEATQSSTVVPTAAAAAAAAAAGGAQATKKMSSGMPKRTRSRFREDLPELPMSPPDSRGASPAAEVEPPLPVLSEARSGENSQEHTPSMPIPIPGRRESPASEQRTIDGTLRQTQTSSRYGNQSTSPQPHAVSLASIDSEGSWLSGRANKRSSSGMGMRDSMSRNTPTPSGNGHRHRSYQSYQSSGSGNNTEEDIAEDEYLSNLATPLREAHDRGFGGRRSGSEDEPMDEPAMEEGDMKWGSVGARQPVLHDKRQSEAMRSREGLLNMVEEDKEDRNSGKSSGEEGGETPHLEEAKSVDFGRKGGHVRHLSAGSAKLLDITPRASVDGKRRPSSGMVV